MILNFSKQLMMGCLCKQLSTIQHHIQYTVYCKLSRETAFSVII